MDKYFKKIIRHIKVSNSAINHLEPLIPIEELERMKSAMCDDTIQLCLATLVKAEEQDKRIKKNKIMKIYAKEFIGNKIKDCTFDDGQVQSQTLVWVASYKIKLFGFTIGVIEQLIKN